MTECSACFSVFLSFFPLQCEVQFHTQLHRETRHRITNLGFHFKLCLLAGHEEPNQCPVMSRTRGSASK